MKDMGEHMKALSFMVNGRSPYNADRVRSAADRIAEHAGRVTKLFPAGSLKHPSEALPAIWNNWDEFARLATDLAAAARKLNGTAGQGVERAKPHVAEVGGACSSCHKKFRKEK